MSDPLDVLDVVVLPVCPEDAIRYGWWTGPAAPHAACCLRWFAPALGASQGDETRGEQVENDRETSERDPGVGCDGDEVSQPVREGIGRSIRPGTPVPATVLVAEMADGSLLLHGWQDGTNAYLCPQDAEPLRQALAAAFGTQDALAGGPGERR